jgi:tetratricopeptide (TPR) repeat protein
MRDEASRYYHTDSAIARRIARRALDLATSSEDPVAVGWGHRAMAEALFLSGRLRAAEPHYRSAAEAWRSVREPGLLGQLLVGWTHLLALLGRHQESEASAKEARRNLEAAGDAAYLAKLAMNLGNVQFQHDRYAPALREYEAAAEIFSRLKVRDQLVIGLDVNRGVALSNLNRDEEALDLFTQLGIECESLGHDLLLAQTRMNAAHVHSQRADFDLALRSLGKAADYFHRTEHPAFLAACHLNRAEIYHQLNLHEEALEDTDQAIPRFKQEGMGYHRALALAQAALSQLALGNSPKAMVCIRRARDLFDREGNRSRVALMDLLWAEAISKRRAPPMEAEERARGAMEAFQKLGLIRWEAAATVLFGRSEARRVGYARQIPRLQKLHRRISGPAYPMTAYRVLEALGEAQEREGNVRAAAGSYRRAARHLEDMRVRIPTEESKIAFLRDKVYLFDRLMTLEASRARPSIDRLFEWAERSRAQSLWDRLRLPGAYLGTAGDVGVDGDSPAVEMLSALRRRISWFHTRIAQLELGSPPERALVPHLRRELTQAERAWARALQEQAAQTGVSGARKGFPSGKLVPPREDRTTALAGSIGGVPELKDIQRALPDGAGFVAYHVGPDDALLLAVTREGRFWRRLKPDLGRRLHRLADRLDFQWGAATLANATHVPVQGRGPRSSSRSMRVLQSTTDSILVELYRLLWQPLDEIGYSGIRSWIVSPHGSIHRVPLHALRDKQGYLIERFDFSTVPSARVWLGLPRSARLDKPVAWVAGLPSPQLPGVEKEVGVVRRHLRGWKVTRDLSPTAAALRSAGSRSHLIHLAVHASLRSDNPGFSYLRLADGPLFVHDLTGVRVPQSTVVLSACSSGRGAAPAGDEWIGLARGFLGIGAAAVVASLWPIHEGPTMELMDRFYESLTSGRSTPEALAGAMRDLIPRGLHPWAWASFGVLGGIQSCPPIV